MRVAIDSSRNPERTPKVLLVAQTRDAGRWMYGVGDGDEAERLKGGGKIASLQRSFVFRSKVG